MDSIGCARSRVRRARPYPPQRARAFVHASHDKTFVSSLARRHVVRCIRTCARSQRHTRVTRQPVFFIVAGCRVRAGHPGVVLRFSRGQNFTTRVSHHSQRPEVATLPSQKLSRLPSSSQYTGLDDGASKWDVSLKGPFDGA